MKHPIAHFEIIGKDHDALVRFYKDIFEWDLQQMPGGTKYSTTADWQPGEPSMKADWVKSREWFSKHGAA